MTNIAGKWFNVIIKTSTYSLISDILLFKPKRAHFKHSLKRCKNEPDEPDTRMRDALFRGMYPGARSSKQS